MDLQAVDAALQMVSGAGQQGGFVVTAREVTQPTSWTLSFAAVSCHSRL